MSKQQRKQIAEAYVNGASPEEIARVLGLALDDVQRVITKSTKPEPESDDDESEGPGFDEETARRALRRGQTSRYGNATVFGNMGVVIPRKDRLI